MHLHSSVGRAQLTLNWGHVADTSGRPRTESQLTSSQLIEPTTHILGWVRQRQLKPTPGGECAHQVTRTLYGPRPNGKVALITGGGHGLGSTLARRYSASGAEVFVTGRAQEVLAESAEVIRKSGGRPEWSVADVSKPISIGERLSPGPSLSG